jgi:hypothetical protein
MAISGKYGKIDIPRIGEDEPVLIIRAQDQLAAAAVELYCILATSHGAPVVDSLQDEIENLSSWGGIKKIPD